MVLPLSLVILSKICQRDGNDDTAGPRSVEQDVGSSLARENLSFAFHAKGNICIKKINIKEEMKGFFENSLRKSLFQITITRPFMLFRYKTVSDYRIRIFFPV